MEPTFITTGFCDWNDAKRRFNQHSNAGIHKEAVLKLSSSKKVDEMLNASAIRSKQTNTAMLSEVIRALKFLARQNLALRGMFYVLMLINVLPLLVLCSTCLFPVCIPCCISEYRISGNDDFFIFVWNTIP